MSRSRPRKNLAGVRFDDEEWAKLRCLTDFYGLDASSVIRMLITAEIRRQGLVVRASTEESSPSEDRPKAG